MILKIFADIFQLCLFVIGCYYFAVGLFSLTVFEKKPKTQKTNSFALIIAAHNEETVIADLVKSLKGLSYPSDKYGIFVIADNCTDKTAEIARESGATVWERTDTQNRGKGFAMEYAFQKLFEMEDGYEYFCVFDADNLVKPDFLTHINAKLNEGYRAVQGYLDSKNPTDNWLTFSYSLWYWLNNRLSQLARGNLDLGCRLGGTGFAVEADLIKKFGWGATCLAEDTEFTLKLALSDILVGWAHKAVVYDEKPTQLGTSINQRKRWMQGLSDVATNYVNPLFKKAVGEKSKTAFHMLMNFWCDTLYPFCMIFFSIVYVLAIFVNKGTFLHTLLCLFWASPLKMLLLSVFVWGNLILILSGLYNDGRLDRNIMKNFMGFIVYILSWIPIGIMGFLKRNEKEWFHTPHSGNKN